MSELTMGTGLFDFLQITIDPDALRAEAAATGILLFGAGGFARSVQRAVRDRGIRVHAHVISGEGPSAIEGVPVVRLADLPPDWLSLPLWLAVFNRNAESDLSDLKDKCQALGITRVLMPQEYFEVIEPDMGWRFWLTDRRQYAAYRTAIETVYQSLADDESRAVYLDILRFRLAVPGARAPKPSPSLQYFPEEVMTALRACCKRPVLVDGGAYDGDTLAAARKHCEPALAFAFEPALANFSRLTANARHFDFPVVCFPCGLSDATGYVSFSSESGESCAICQNGAERIQVARLDECLPGQRVDFIKLDVEGHEVPALEGARQLFEIGMPILAVAAYHRWDDLWRIPAFVMHSSTECRLLLRAHESNSFDSVLYGIPPV
jgi:FkbM family methyltransferase